MITGMTSNDKGATPVSNTLNVKCQENFIGEHYI